MSANAWRKRPIVKVICPSGMEVTVRRPSPSVMLKAGKLQRIFQRQNAADRNSPDKQLEFIESLPDDELATVWVFARVIVVDAVIDPPLFLEPKESQLSPDDIPINDFWHIFGWAQMGGRDLPVATTGGETTVEAVETFPSGQDPSADVSSDSEQIQ